MLLETSAIATLGWVARARAVASKSSYDEAEAWMAAVRVPMDAIRIVKAPIGAGSSTDSDLGEFGVSRFIDDMQTKSAFYRMLSDGAFVRVPLNTRVAVTTVPATGWIVGEGAASPVSRVTMQSVLVEPVKAIATSVFTDVQVRDISGAGQKYFNRQLTAPVGDAVDKGFLDLITDTGTTSVPSSGVTAVDAKSDLRAALLAVNSAGSSQLYWVASIDVAKMASTLGDTSGGDAFGAMSATGGELANLPALVSAGAPSGSLYLIDASGIAAGGDAVKTRITTQADILMDTMPNMSSATPTPAQLISMWQTNSTAVETSAWFGAQVLRDDAVAVIEDIAWGGP